MSKQNTGGAKAPETKKEPQIIKVAGLANAEKKRLEGYKVVEVKLVDNVKTYFMEAPNA